MQITGMHKMSFYKKTRFNGRHIETFISSDKYIDGIFFKVLNLTVFQLMVLMICSDAYSPTYT